MSLNTSGIEELRLRIARLATVPEVANAELKLVANEMAELARKFAPLDVGNLEKAIKVKYEAGRDASGRFIKGGSYSVYIDNDMSVDGRPGKTIGDYAWEIHEYLGPSDINPGAMMKLGEKSEEKQSGQQERVGGKFLERAGEAFREKASDRVAQVVFRYIQSMDIG